MSTTFTIAARLTADTAQFNRAMVGAQSTMGKLGDKLSSMGNKMRNAGRMMTVMVTLPIAALGVTAVKAFSEFDDAMNQSLAIMGDVSNSMKNKMSSAAREMAKESIFSAKEAAQAFFFLASAGLDAEQSIAALPVVTRFAQAGMFDLETATSLLMNAVSALGLKSKDATKMMEQMTRVSDVLTKANILSDGTTRQFAEALTSKAAAALKTFHKSVEEGVAVLSVFADQGLKGKRGGEALTIVLQDVARAAARNTDQVWTKFGIQVFDSTGKLKNLADVVKEFEKALIPMNDQARAAALEQLELTRSVGKFTLQLLGTSDQISTYERALLSAGNITEKVANKQLESFKSQLALVKNRITDVLISVGEKLAPFFSELAEHVAKAFEWFGKLSETTQRWVFIIGGLLAIAGPLLLIFGSILKVFASFATISEALGVKTLPLLLAKLSGIAIVVGAVIAAFVYFGGTLKQAISIIEALAEAFALLQLAKVAHALIYLGQVAVIAASEMGIAAAATKGLAAAMALLSKTGPLIILTAAVWAINKAIDQNTEMYDRGRKAAGLFKKELEGLTQGTYNTAKSQQKLFTDLGKSINAARNATQTYKDWEDRSFAQENTIWGKLSGGVKEYEEVLKNLEPAAMKSSKAVQAMNQKLRDLGMSGIDPTADLRTQLGQLADMESFVKEKIIDANIQAKIEQDKALQARSDGIKKFAKFLE